MAVPKFYEFFVPVLRKLRDGEPMKSRDLIAHVAAAEKLTPEDMAEMLPSGTQATYRNRIHWAITYLKKASLVASPAFGVCQITEKGKKACDTEAAKIDLAYVMKRMSKEDSDIGSEIGPKTEERKLTPSEQMDDAYNAIYRDLCDSLLQNIMSCSPAFFERLVVQLLVRMGYGYDSKTAGYVIGKTGDGGIDGVINEDKLGFSQVYMQAKRWDASHTVGSPEVQAFAGALLGKGAVKGLFITTSHFSKAAQQYVNDQKAMRVVLVDGKELARLMIDYNVGVSEQQVYTIKQIDSDYFGSIIFFVGLT